MMRFKNKLVTCMFLVLAACGLLSSILVEAKDKTSSTSGELSVNEKRESSKKKASESKSKLNYKKIQLWPDGKGVSLKINNVKAKKYTSSDKKVVKVTKKGKVTPVKPGIAEIKVTGADGNVYKCEVMVASKGLEYTDLGKGKAAVAGIGSCKDKNVFIGEETPDGKKVEKIKDRAFQYNEKIVSVYIPDSVISLGEYAFYDCFGLTKVRLSDNIKQIENSSFYNCTSLYDINFPIRCLEIGDHAFSTCASLKSVSLPKGLIRIGYCAFYNCTSLTLINFPKKIKVIGNCAFENCNSLKKVQFYGQLKKLGSSAFECCSALFEISLPKGLDTIQDRTFYCCSSLEKVKLPDGIKTIEDNAFLGCHSLKKIKLPDSIEIIGERAFAYDSSLSEINLPVNIVELGSNAFGHVFLDLSAGGLPSKLFQFTNLYIPKNLKDESILSLVKDSCNYVPKPEQNGKEEIYIHEANLLFLEALEEMDIHEDDSRYTKVKKVHDWMCRNIEYDYDGLGGVRDRLPTDSYSVLKNKMCVCDGYANLFFTFLSYLNIDCAKATSKKADHAWNMVLMDDGYWYHVDVTWDDDYFDDIDYFYFLINHKGLFKDQMGGCLRKDYKISILFYENSIKHLNTSLIKDLNIEKNSENEHYSDAFTFPIPINSINIPDEEFRKIVSSFDVNGDKKLSESEANAVNSMDLSSYSIKNLKGIEYFANLTRLSISCGELDCFDLKENSGLEYLTIYDYTLDELNLSSLTNLKSLYLENCSISSQNLKKNTKLEYLNIVKCSNLSSLIISKCTNINNLKIDKCSNLSSLDISKCNGIKKLSISECSNLSSLDISDSINLSSLYVFDTSLSGIDLTHNTKLTYIYIEKNPIKEIDISKNVNLHTLLCRGLNKIDVKNNKHLTDIFCEEDDIIIENRNILIDEQSFEDEKFRAYISENIDTDKNGVLSEKEINAVKYINVNSKGIESLDGAYLFSKSLESLECAGNKLSSIDYSYAKKLTKLNCSNNPYLTDINCYSCKLNELNISGCPKLYDIDCACNQISVLNISDSIALNGIDCRNNLLTDLDISRNVGLQSLYCGHNPINKLDLTNNLYLDSSEKSTSKICDDNVKLVDNFVPVSVDKHNFPDDAFRSYILSSVDKNNDGMLSKKELRMKSITISDSYGKIKDLSGIEYFTSLEEIECANIGLVKIDLSKNTILKRLDCKCNSLTGIDIGKNPLLFSLDCSFNRISNLDLSKNVYLEWLNCRDNMLTNLDVRNNPLLLQLMCYKNAIMELDLRQNPMLISRDCEIFADDTVNIIFANQS